MIKLYLQLPKERVRTFKKTQTVTWASLRRKRVTDALKDEDVRIDYDN